MLGSKFLLFIFVVSILMAGAIVINPASAELQASLWAPDEIILKQKYTALIIVDENTGVDYTFDIITDNEEVLKILTKTVTIPSGKHHGLVELESIGIGNAKLYAIFQETLLQENLNVVESAESPVQLDLILPSNLVNVLVDDNEHIGYIFLLNNFENPVPAKEPIDITLTNNGDVLLSSEIVTIQKGEHYTKFLFEAKGEGSISASAQNLTPDDEDISIEDPDEIELKIAVAPNPIPTDSSAEIYFWLERGGDPYVSTHDVTISISIGKSSNLSFDSAMEGAIVLTPDTVDRRATTNDAREIVTRTQVQLSQDSKREFLLEAGNHYGKMQAYSSFDSAQSIIISGLAESVNTSDDEETIKDSESITVSTESSSFSIGTETRVFAFPDPAYDTVEIIISSFSDDGPVIERDDESFTIFTDNKLDLERGMAKIIRSDSNYAIVKATIIDSGTSDIFAERNEASSDEISISTSGKYVKDPELEIVSFPVIFNVEQDLFLISSTQEKITTDANVIDKNLISITSRPHFEFEIIQESESVISARGIVSEVLEEDPEIHVSSNAFTVDGNLEVYNPERKRINALHPNSVYPQEPFPIVTHIEDLNGQILRKDTLKISSIANMSLINNLFYLNDIGSHALIFYEDNSVPLESSIEVKGAVKNNSGPGSSENEEIIRITTYNVEVIGGEGSGTFDEEEEITISAAQTIDDIFIMKKKFVGWKDLPHTESTVTFEIDENLTTRPIYEDDYTYLFLMVGSVGGVTAIIILKKKKNSTKEDKKTDSKEEELLELLKD